MELLDEILNPENLNKAYRKVVSNKGVAGVDGITTGEVAEYINQVDGKIEIRETKYKINDLMDVVYEQSNNMLDTNNIDFSISWTLPKI